MMEKSIIRVDGMSCQHCVKAVSGAVNALPGIESVEVDLAAKTWRTTLPRAASKP